MAAATNSTLGTVALAGDLAGTSTTPELAPTGVKAGSHQNVTKIHVDSKGRIQWCGGANYEQDIKPSMPIVSANTAGMFYVGPNINVSSGTISVSQASASTKGIFKVGNNLEINQSTGAIDVIIPVASASQKGTVQVGSGFAINGGVLSRNGAGIDASGVAKGVVKIGANISINYGTISIPYATDTVAGVAPIDNSNFYKDPATQTLFPHAAHPALYGMVFGWSNDFYLNGEGKLSLNNPNLTTIASDTVLGNVKIGANLYMTGDNQLTLVRDADTSNKGLVSVGSGLTVTSGVLSAELASDSQWGLACVGDPTATLISYNTTPISAPGLPEDGSSGLRFRRCDTAAQNLAYAGVVRSANMNNISINNGVLDVGINIAKKNTANIFTKAQVTAKQTFVDTDWSRGNVIELTMTSNITSVPAPINATAGQIMNLIVRQDATGGRTLTGWNSVYKFNGTLTLSTAPNAVDIITIICKSSTEFLVLPSLGYQ